jgi:exosortase A
MCQPILARRLIKTVPWLSLMVAIGALIPLLGDTFPSMVRQWNFTAYQHCYLIAPVSAWLAWRLRPTLCRITWIPSIWAATGVFGVTCVWLLGTLSEVQLLRHVAGVALIPLCIWAIAGSRLVAAAAFPCAYLFFTIPAGDSLLPTLMNLTADFIATTVAAFGVPIFRDGLMLTTASGQFAVVEACAGLKFLLAMAPVATLFAYLFYRSWPKRIIFVLITLAIAVLANGVRASIVVLVASYTHMRLLTGSDHIVFGEILYAAVMLLTLAVGLRFADRQSAQMPEQTFAAPPPALPSVWRFALAAALFLMLVAIAPISASAINARAASRIDTAITRQLPAAQKPWTGPYDASFDSIPVFSGAAGILSGQYRFGGQRIDLHVIFYRSQDQGRELVNARNTVYDPTKWRDVGESNRTVTSNQQSQTVTEIELRSARGERRLVRTWYSVGGRQTHEALAVKLLELRDKLTGRPSDSAAFAVSTPIEIDIEQSRQTLDQFMASGMPGGTTGVTGARGH